MSRVDPACVLKEHVRTYAHWVSWVDNLPPVEGRRGVWLWVSPTSGHVLGVGSTPTAARRHSVLMMLDRWLVDPGTDDLQELIEEAAEPGQAVELVGDPITLGRLLSSLVREGPIWLVVAEVAGEQLARAS